MPSKTTRTIISLGNSRVIALPHDWIEGSGLKPGDVLEVWYDEKVTVLPPKNPTRKQEQKT